MPYFEHDGLRFHYRCRGDGVPVVWQHGLGSDADQTFALLEQPPAGRRPRLPVRRSTRRRTARPGRWATPRRSAIATTADDLAAFLDQQGIELRRDRRDLDGRGRSP